MNTTKSNNPYQLNLKTQHPEKILVINCGSSSLKYTLFNTGCEGDNFHGLVEKIDSDEMVIHSYSHEGKKTRALQKGGHSQAFGAMIEALLNPKTGAIGATEEITSVGHRVVHGGDVFSSSVIITDEVLQKIDNLSNLAPLHNPINVIGINEARRMFSGAKHVAVFDTAFHHTIPPCAFLYGLPYEYYSEKNIRKYGFHGTSHFYVALKSAEYLKNAYNDLKMITCHLGNGASMCAIDHGASVDTTMGFTPTDGLIMGTRCGSIDPAILIHLMNVERMNADDLNTVINKESGLLGLSGISNDMREIEAASKSGNKRALLAYETFCYVIRKNIGAYMAAMCGLDVVIFTGGIGEGSHSVRNQVCQKLDCMGVWIDEKKNRDAGSVSEVVDISKDKSKIRILVIPTNEELMIAREAISAIDQ